MATISKAKAKAAGTYTAPNYQKPDDWMPHFVRVVVEGKGLIAPKQVTRRR